MLGYWEWVIGNNHWVGVTILSTLILLWSLSLGTGRPLKEKIIYILIVFVVGGGALSYTFSYGADYRNYKRHYTTCSKPEAKAAGYQYSSEKERCYRPVVGLVPLDNNSVIEVK